MPQDTTDSSIRKPSARRVKGFAIVAGLASLALATVVLGYFNIGQVVAAMRPVGLAGFAAAIAAQVVLFVPLGLAWWSLTDRQHGLWGFVWSRLLREAVSDILPLSQLGGLAAASRAVSLCGAPIALAAGSAVADAMVEAGGQVAYTAIGLGILVNRLGAAARDGSMFVHLGEGVAVSAVLVVAIIGSHRRWTGWLSRRIGQMFPALAEQVAAVGEVINRGLGNPLRVSLSLALHLTCWFGAAGGTWLILRFAGHPLPFASVVGMESLLFAVRNAAFMAPSGVGVQEAAYALLGPLFGIPPQAALALSLIKRARDIVVGLPVLLSWQLMERRHALTPR